MGQIYKNDNVAGIVFSQLAIKNASRVSNSVLNFEVDSQKIDLVKIDLKDSKQSCGFFPALPILK